MNNKLTSWQFKISLKLLLAPSISPHCYAYLHRTAYEHSRLHQQPSVKRQLAFPLWIWQDCTRQLWIDFKFRIRHYPPIFPIVYIEAVTGKGDTMHNFRCQLVWSGAFELKRGKKLLRFRFRWMEWMLYEETRSSSSRMNGCYEYLIELNFCIFIKPQYLHGNN